MRRTGARGPFRGRLRRRLLVLGVAFGLSGLVGLLAEQAFEKLLSTLLGASTPAAAVVLAVYFAGLTLGGVAYGRLPRTWRSAPLRMYAILESGIALWALVLALAWERLIPWFVPFLARGAGDFWRLEGLRFVAAAAWILPATIPMGASFPAAVDALDSLRVPARRRFTAGLYTVNLFGAILGAIAGPYAAFPTLGVDGTLLLAAGLDAVAALLALRLAAVSRRRAPRAEVPVRAESGGAAALLAVAALSGFLFFSLEVVWTHLIGAVLGNSVYAFGTMLGVILVGLGLGSLASAVLRPSRDEISAGVPGALLIFTGFLLAATHGSWPDAPRRLAEWTFGIGSFGAAEWARWKSALALLLPTATALGMVYPMLFRLRPFPARERGALAGRLVAANSVGCILGALATAFVLVPALGSERTLQVLGLGATLSGAALVLAYGRTGKRTSVGALALVVVLTLLQPRWNRLELTSGRNVYFQRNQVLPFSKLRFFHEDTLGGITTVVENPPPKSGGAPVRILLTNGKFQGDDSGEADAQNAVALVPSLFVPAYGRALVIGLGTGASTHVAERLGFEHVDVAEIAPGIVNGARQWFRHLNGDVLASPRVSLFLEDGRNVLLLKQRRYDMISIEVSSIWFQGATNLYSREFHRLAAGRLSPDGVLQQWIQVHHIGPRELQSVLATLRSVFPVVSFWVVGGQGIAVGSFVPQRVQPSFLSAVAERGVALGGTRETPEGSFAALLASRLLAPEDVTRLAGRSGLVVNTDGNRWLEYQTPRYNHLFEPLERRNLAALAADATFPPPLFAPGASGALAEAGRRVGPADYRRRFAPALSAPNPAQSR